MYDLLIRSNWLKDGDLNKQLHYKIVGDLSGVQSLILLPGLHKRLKGSVKKKTAAILNS